MHRHSTQHINADLRAQLHQKPAPSAVDGDAREFENAFLDEHGHLLLRAEGRRASHQKPAVAIGDLGLAGLDAFGADR